MNSKLIGLFDKLQFVVGVRLFLKINDKLKLVGHGLLSDFQLISPWIPYIKPWRIRIRPRISDDFNSCIAEFLLRFGQVRNSEANVTRTKKWFFIFDRQMQLRVADFIPRAVLSRRRRLRNLFETEH